MILIARIFNLFKPAVEKYAYKYSYLSHKHAPRILSNEFSSKQVGFPSQSQVVIAGSGIVANSVAYHLSQNGWNDVIVLEQNTIASGTSDFSSGVLGLFKPIAMRNLIKYSIKLYRQLQELGFDIGLKQTGSLNLAQTRDRMIAMKRRMAYNLPTGLHCESVSPNEIKRIYPDLRTEDLEGGVWVPDDAVANPKAICIALSKLARQGGVQYYENCLVQEVLTENGHVHGVQTDCGIVRCQIFINCAGMWARELGLHCNPQVRIPAYPAEQYYVIAEKNTDPSLPCVRDFDGQTYAREWKGNLLIGWFEEEAKPAFGDSGVPRNWKKHIHQDYRHFQPLWEKAIHRIPHLKNIVQPSVLNSADNFTPDGRWILGETPEVKNYFVACGMNGNSLQGSGGIGKTVAEWIIEGRPTINLLQFNVARFLDLHNNRQYLQQRTKEVVGRPYMGCVTFLTSEAIDTAQTVEIINTCGKTMNGRTVDSDGHFSILYPHQCEYKYARKLRCSPLYSVLEKRGAVFGIKMAYERALYFDTSHNAETGIAKMPPGSFYKPKFFEFMHKEYLACREGVGIIDMSSFSKIEIKLGYDQSTENEVLNYLQNLCSNDVNIPIGGLVHTGMQNEEGGYENDCMLVRLGTSDYFMVSPSSQQTRIYDWMSKHLPSDNSVILNDVTSMYTVINVVGPKSHELMNELSSSKVNLNPYTFKYVDVGYASDVMVMGFTHTGEPGYCLYVPSEYALHVYDRLMTVGRDYGVRDVGTLTQLFMRIERFIPFWADELTSSVTPFEAGNGYRVKLGKDYFIGKYALQHQKERGVTKKLVMFHVENIDPDSDIWPWGGEPLYRNNQFVGTVTSAGYGFTTDKLVCLGFIQKPDTMNHSNITNKTVPEHNQQTVTEDYIMDKNATYQIDIAGQRFPLTPHIYAPHFPNESHGIKKTYRPTVVSLKRESLQ